MGTCNIPLDNVLKIPFHRYITCLEIPKNVVEKNKNKNV